MASDIEVPALANARDIDPLSALLAAAFAEDPMLVWPMPKVTPQSLQALFREILVAYVELDVLWKVDDCVGTAAWLPPAAAEQFVEIELNTRPAIYRLTDDGGARYAEFWDWLGGHLPDEPCWFLDMIAVHPLAQGQGIGRVLMQHGLDRASAEGLPVFLETGNADNVPLYESFGFRTVDRQQAPSGGPTIWFMQTAD